MAILRKSVRAYKVASAEAIVELLPAAGLPEDRKPPQIKTDLRRCGAANRTRTGTGLLQADFKSAMSTYSIIAAYEIYLAS